MSKTLSYGLLSHYSRRTGYSVYTYYYSPANKKAADLGSKSLTAIRYLVLDDAKVVLFFGLTKLLQKKVRFLFQKCNFYHSEVQPYYSEVQLYYGNNRATFCVAN